MIETRWMPMKGEWRIDDVPDSGISTIRGHAAVFNQVAGYEWAGFDEQVAPGAFLASIAAGDDVRAVFNHDPNFVLGRRNGKTSTLRLSEDDIGLWVEIDAPQTQTIRDLVLEPIRRGDIDQMSFRFETLREEWNKDANLRTLLEVKLVDVSPVTFPWYEGTDVSVRSQMSTIREDALRREMERRATIAAKLNKLNYYERARISRG